MRPFGDAAIPSGCSQPDPGRGFTKSRTTPCSGCAASTGCAIRKLSVTTNGTSQRCIASSPLDSRCALAMLALKQREYLARDTVHLFPLRAALDEQELDADAFELPDALGDLLGRADEPR